MQLIVDTKGVVMSKRNNCFHLRTEKHERLISPARVTSIAVWSYCMLSSAAIKLAIENQIPIYFLDAFGNVVGKLGSASFGNQADLRRQQVYFRDSVQATEWVIYSLRLKADLQIANLSYLANRKQAEATMLNGVIEQMKATSESIDTNKNQLLDDCADTIRGKEGTIARYYWQALAEIMPAPLNFKERVQQNPPDAFNTTLNYLYGILYGMVETSIFSVGLDPYMGILHGDQIGKPTLSYDLIEPFRPMADRMIIEFVLTDRITDDYYTKEEQSVRLSKKGKEALIPAFHEWLEEKVLLDGTKPLSRKNHIYEQAGILKNNILEFDKSQQK